MTYLELCQKLCQRVGIPAGMTTTVSQTGEYGRVATWINDAWNDIQTAHQDWGWMRTTASFTTVAGTGIYTLGTGAGTVGVTAATFGMWDLYTARNYTTSVGINSEIFMAPIDYDSWRDTYQFNANRSVQTRPSDIAAAPNKSLCLGPFPAAGYTITCDYFTAPTQFSADSDTPTMPTWFQNAIIYKAMMYYASYESAPEVYSEGEVEFMKLMKRMAKDRTPRTVWAGALA